MKTVINTNLIVRDLKHIWHPCAQMKDYEVFPPLAIKKAEGSYIELQNGKKLIDATSSWWCKALGHNHPRLKQALINQAHQFEHVMFAHTTHENIVELSERLAKLIPSLSYVSYASDGSSAVESALKMSLHTRFITQQNKRTLFASLSNGYHGETCGALSMGDLGIYKKAYQSILLPVKFISNIPYVSETKERKWNDCKDIWPTIENQLDPLAEQLTAIIVEPIVQGPAGMMIYSQDFLRRLRQWSQNHDIHLIADEVFTGFGRTGVPLACNHADITPDFLCLGKNLTGGWLPMSAMLTRTEIYEIFYDDYQKGKSFLHSHTFSGNSLAAAVALECLKVIEEEQIYAELPKLTSHLRNAMNQVAASTNQLTAVRGIGAIVAADLINPADERMGFKVYQQAAKLGALLRPIGNTIYWTPPLNCSLQTIDELQEITTQAIIQVR